MNWEERSQNIYTASSNESTKKAYPNRRNQEEPVGGSRRSKRNTRK